MTESLRYLKNKFEDQVWNRKSVSFFSEGFVSRVHQIPHKNNSVILVHIFSWLTWALTPTPCEAASEKYAFTPAMAQLQTPPTRLKKNGKTRLRGYITIPKYYLEVKFIYIIKNQVNFSAAAANNLSFSVWKFAKKVRRMGG